MIRIGDRLTVGGVEVVVQEVRPGEDGGLELVVGVELEVDEELLERVRGNLRRGLVREEVPESTVLPPPPPSRARRLPREGVRMLCLEDDEERVCYLDLGHDGAHGFEAVSDAG